MHSPGCCPWQGLTLDQKYLEALQVLLGKVIDIAEGEYDGTTRQVCLSLCLSRMICHHNLRQPCRQCSVRGRSAFILADAGTSHHHPLRPQITVDEKGLAAIFVFGLPGVSHSSHAPPCLNAASKVVDVMTAGGISSSAGLATGNCFCGLVGEATRRCEYAVIGGEAPRL